jgi:hypothetical protein
LAPHHLFLISIHSSVFHSFFVHSLQESRLIRDSLFNLPFNHLINQYTHFFDSFAKNPLTVLFSISHSFYTHQSVKMFSYIFASALLAAPLVAGHGKVTVFTGDKGGNGTALGIKGAAVANAGQNYQTETDTTIFWSKDIKTDDDFGFTQSSNGNLGMKDLVNAMALSGSTIPQVSSGGSINATLHVVTSDGAGPFTAIVDSTASGKFSSAVEMDVTTQVPGEGGWIDTTPSAEALAAGNGKIIERWVSRTVGQKASRTVGKRQTATLVDRDYVSSLSSIPAMHGSSCTNRIPIEPADRHPRWHFLHWYFQRRFQPLRRQDQQQQRERPLWRCHDCPDGLNLVASSLLIYMS